MHANKNSIYFIIPCNHVGDISQILAQAYVCMHIYIVLMVPASTQDIISKEEQAILVKMFSPQCVLFTVYSLFHHRCKYIYIDRRVIFLICAIGFCALLEGNNQLRYQITNQQLTCFSGKYFHINYIERKTNSFSTTKIRHTFGLEPSSQHVAANRSLLMYNSYVPHTYLVPADSSTVNGNVPSSPQLYMPLRLLRLRAYYVLVRLDISRDHRSHNVGQDINQRLYQQRTPWSTLIGNLLSPHRGLARRASANYYSRHFRTWIATVMCSKGLGFVSGPTLRVTISPHDGSKVNQSKCIARLLGSPPLSMLI